MANWRSRVWMQIFFFFFGTGATSLKLADREECLTNCCCEFKWLIWNYPIIAGSPSAECKTTQEAGRGFLSTPCLSGSFWRSCKVGPRWCDKHGQTLWLSSNLQQAKPRAGCCRCLSLTSTAAEDKLMMHPWTWRPFFGFINCLTLFETTS